MKTSIASDYCCFHKSVLKKLLTYAKKAFAFLALLFDKNIESITKIWYNLQK